MTTRIVCDICGAVPDDPRMGSITVRDPDGTVAYAPDVCADCLAVPLLVDVPRRALGRVPTRVPNIPLPGDPDYPTAPWAQPGPRLALDDEPPGADHLHAWEGDRCTVCGAPRWREPMHDDQGRP